MADGKLTRLVREVASRGEPMMESANRGPYPGEPGEGRPQDTPDSSVPGPMEDAWKPFRPLRHAGGIPVPGEEGSRPEGSKVGCYLFSCLCRAEDGSLYHTVFPGLLNPALEDRPILWGLTPLHDILGAAAWRHLPPPHAGPSGNPA